MAPALELAGRLAAGVVQRHAEANGWGALLPENQQVAFAGACIVALGRGDLYVCFDSGYALEVLQRLFDVAQIEQVAALGRHGIPGSGPGRSTGRETDVADATGNDGQCQRAGCEVLRRGEDARGDEAA